MIFVKYENSSTQYQHLQHCIIYKMQLILRTQMMMYSKTEGKK